MKFAISKIIKVHKTNSVLSERIAKYKWAYYLLNGLVTFTIVLMSLGLFILTPIVAGSDFYKNMTLIFSMTLLFNLSILNGRHHSSTTISIYELKYFPIKPAELLLIYVKIFITDIRYLNYFFVLILLTTGMILRNYELYIILFFCITLMLYFIFFEVIFSNFFLIRKKLPQSLDKKITAVIPLFGFIIFMLIAQKYYHSIPILTLPVDLLISLLSDNIIQSLTYFGAIVTSTILMILITYRFVKNVIA